MARQAQKLNPDGYIHARDADEYQRLRDQALMWQRASEEVLDRVGLAAGMSALDVGSGPGAVMRLMADRVGEHGVRGIGTGAGGPRRACPTVRAGARRSGGAPAWPAAPRRARAGPATPAS